MDGGEIGIKNYLRWAVGISTGTTSYAFGFVFKLLTYSKCVVSLLKDYAQEIESSKISISGKEPLLL